MLKHMILALIALTAAPAAASKGTVGLTQASMPVDMLYPEIPVSEDAWRGLLPVILLDIDEVAEQPAQNNERSGLR
jgi:hypothetical protein